MHIYYGHLTLDAPAIASAMHGKYGNFNAASRTVLLGRRVAAVNLYWISIYKSGCFQLYHMSSTSTLPAQ